MMDTDWNKMNPVALWRDWIVKSEQQWSEGMSKMLKQEGTGGAMTKQIDEARMMHRQFSEMAQMSLAAANMPSRTDIEMLDERMGRLEDGFAAMCAELSQLRAALVNSGGVKIGGVNTGGINTGGMNASGKNTSAVKRASPGTAGASLAARPSRNRKPVKSSKKA